MPLSYTILGWAQMLVSLVTGVASIWFVLACFGQVVGTHRHCRKCRYDLFGLDRPEQCPECGANLLRRNAARIGLRQHNPQKIITLLAVAILGHISVHFIDQHKSDIQRQPSLFLAAVRQGDVKTASSMLATYPRFAQGRFFGDSDSTAPIHLAIAFARSPRTVQLLLDHRADPNDQNLEGDAPLHEAVTYRSPSIISLLLEAGADPNRRGKDGMTSLHIAAQQGDDNAASVLIEAGAAVDRTDDGGNTPLYWAALHNNRDTIKLLLDSEADVNAKNNAGRTPLHAAVHARHHDAAIILVDQGADPSIRDKTGAIPGMSSKIQFYNMDTTSTFSMTETAVSVWWHLLKQAKGQDDLESVLARLLLAPEVLTMRSPYSPDTLIHLAVNTHDRQLVALLLDCGADPALRNARNQTAIELAESLNDPTIKKMLDQALAKRAAASDDGQR